MRLTPWMVFLCLGLVACSGSKSAQKVNEDLPQIELSDADEFVETPADGEAAVVPDELTTESENPATEETPSDEPAVTEAVTDAPGGIVLEGTSEPTESVDAVVAASAPVEASGGEKSYTVQKNETLMLIAFKLFGDYEKWKTLANYNSQTLKGSTNVREGMTLKYQAPAEEFVWNPQGLPYLIRTGDTLGLISKSVYTTSKKWKLIWENNRPLIKDPNKIFAGFTIYYLENGREVATQL